MTDRPEEPGTQPPPLEGVRILGAEEAQVATRGDERDEAEPKSTRAPVDPSVQPVLSFPLPDPQMARFPEGGPTWSAASVEGEGEPAEGPATPTATEGPAGLPHWTEPPTGEVPAVGGEDADDLDTWASVTGGQPRFRAEGADWSETDFEPAELAEAKLKVGALADEPQDEQEAFEEELWARRRRGGTRSSVAAGAASAGLAAPEAGGERPGVDTSTRLVTALVIAGVSILCFVLGRGWTALLVAAIAGVGALELSTSLRDKAFRPAVPVALVGSAGLALSAYHYGVAAYPVFGALMVLFSLLWYLWQVGPGRPLLGVAGTLFVFGYVGVLAGFGGLMLEARDGIGLVVGVVACAVAYDVFGYFVGKQIGETPIAPRISPHKTLQGTLAGVGASVVVGWLVIGGPVSFLGIAPWDARSGLVLGILVGIGAFLGDLCESMLKRDLGVKDFGTMLPGHGGMLDRFDGILFALPIGYYLALHLDLIRF